MNKNILIALGVALVVVLGGAFLFMQSQGTEPTVTTAPQVTTSTQQPTAEGAPEAVEIKVESNGLKFTASTITVKKGQTVTVTYKNNMGKHDWVLDEFNVSTELIDAGEEETITFVADKAGTFEFYCSVAGHRESGMKGAFIVTE